MKRWAIAIVLSFCPIILPYQIDRAAAATLACRSSPGSDGYYQYRLIDNRKCWFRGHTKLEKSALAWKADSRAGAKQTLAPSTKPFASQGSAVHVPNSEFDSRDGSQPDFDAVFGHFRAYDVARPPVHLLYPTRVAQAYGAKRVAVVVYRRPE
jgi:hypothetical protein